MGLGRLDGMMLKPSFLFLSLSFLFRGERHWLEGGTEREETSRNDILISLILKLSKASWLYDREQHHIQSGK
jgi:hypothetical protein